MTEAWLGHVASELGVDPNIERDALLDAARVVAHSVERKATPLTTYLIGVAVGAGRAGDVEATCKRVIELARAWDPGDDDDADRKGS